MISLWMLLTQPIEFYVVEVKEWTLKIFNFLKRNALNFLIFITPLFKLLIKKLQITTP
jgi:hypothetical protein